MQPDREAKSVGAEDTFSFDLTTPEEMNLELEKIASVVQGRLSRYQLKGRTITLKIKYHDFKQITRSQSFEEATDDLELIENTAKQLLSGTDLLDKKVRLLGISLSNFNYPAIRTRTEADTDQLTLF